MKVRQSEFAKMLGVGRTAINNLVKRGTLVVDINNFIDTNHKRSQKYIRMRQEKCHKNDLPGIRTIEKEKTKGRPKKYTLRKPITNKIAGLYEKDDDYDERLPNPKPNEPINYKEYGIEIEQKTITDTKKLLEDFGPVVGKQVMEIERLKADAALKKIMLKEKKGDLISREKMANFLILYLNILNKKILDFPAQTIDRIIAICETKEDPKHEIIDLIIDNLSIYIKDTKKEVVRRVKQFWSSPVQDTDIAEDNE